MRARTYTYTYSCAYTYKYTYTYSGLSRLIKVLSRADYSDVTKVGKLAVIPEKATIARRLAQSMNPILPSGVHRKALDVYRIILPRIGGEQLAADLALWSQGLFSLFAHANEECKLLCVKLITDSFLPLGPHLVPSLDGLIMALAPALEDEASGSFQPTVALIFEIQSAVGQYEFFRTLWWVLGASGGGRQAVLLLLQRSLAAAGGLQAPHVLSDADVAVRGLVLALEDASILVQRAVLDLLLSHVPFASAALPDIVTREDEVCAERGGTLTLWMVLTRAAVRLYARRDMSLTRRLHLWLSPPLHAHAVSNRVGGESAAAALHGSAQGESDESCSEGDKSSGGTARFVWLISWAVQRLLEETYHDSSSATLAFRVARAVMDKGSSWGDGRQGGAGALARALVVPLMQALHRTGVDKRQGTRAPASSDATSARREGNQERLDPGERGHGRHRLLASERYHFAVNTIRDLDMHMVWLMLHQHLALCLSRNRPAASAHAHDSDSSEMSEMSEMSECLSLARCFFDEFIVVHSGWGVEKSGEGVGGGEGGGREEAVRMCMRVLAGTCFCFTCFFCFLCLWLCLALPLRRLPLPASVSLPASVCACVSWVGSPMCLVRADAGMRLVHAHAGLGLESFPLVFDAPFLALRFWTRGA